MQPYFTIDVEPKVDLILIRMGGFFAENDISDFRQALGEKIKELHCLPNDHITHCNVVDMKIQTQDIVSAFSKVVGDWRFRSKRLAFVTGSTLARMQTQRLTDREGVVFFTDDDAARTWLLSPSNA